MDIRIGNDIRLRFYFDSSRVNINEDNIISAECKIVKSTDYEKFMSLSNNCVLSEYEFHTCGRPTYNVMPHYFHRNCGIFTFDGVCDHEHNLFWHHPFFHKHCYSTKQFTAQSYESVTVVDVIYPGKCQDCIGPYKVMLQLVTADSEWNISGMHTYLFDYNPIDFRLVGNGGKCGSITIFFGSADAQREIISSTPWEIEKSFVKPAEIIDYKKKTIELSGAVTRSVVYSYSDGRPNSEEIETAGIYWKVSTDGISYESVGANYTIPEYNEDLNENRIFYFKGYITDKEGDTINIEDANFNIIQSVKPHIKLNQSQVYVNFNEKTDILPISIYGNVNLDDINIVPSIGSITISKQDGVYYYTISEYNGDSMRTGIVSIKHKDDPVYSFTINQYGKNIVIRNFAINRTTSKYIDAEPSGDRLSMRSNLELHYSYDKYSILFDGTEELIESVYDNGATISGRVKVNNYGIVRSEENTGNIYWPINYDIEPRSVDVVITATIGELEDTITLTSTQKASEVEYTEFWDKPIITRFEYFTLTYNGEAVLPYEIEATQNKIRRYSDGREDEIIQTITREDHVLSFELAFSGDPDSEYYDNVDPDNGKVTFPGTNYGPNDINIKAILVVTANGVASDPVEAIATQLANPNPEPEETFEYIWQTPTVVKFEYEDVDYNITDSYPTLVITQNQIKRYSSSKPDEIVDTITYSDNSDQFNLIFGGTNVNNSGKVTFPGPNNGTEPHTTTVTLTVIANNKTSIQYTAIATQKVNPSANTPIGYYGFKAVADIVSSGITTQDTPYEINGVNYEVMVNKSILSQNEGKNLIVIINDIMKPLVKTETTLGNKSDILIKDGDLTINGESYTVYVHPNSVGNTWNKLIITPSTETIL